MTSVPDNDIKAANTLLDPANTKFRPKRTWKTLLRLTLAMAINELNQRYKRTILGRWWIALTFAFFVTVKIVIFSTLNDVSLPFFATYLALGFLAFRFISLSITGGASVFVSSQNWIKTETLPLPVYLIAFTMKSIIMGAYMAIVALAVCFFMGYGNGLGLLWLSISTVIFAINCMWVSCFLGMITARYRDIAQLLQTLMQVALFATPILWVPTETGIRSFLALYNPLSHYLAILRQPLMEGTIPWLSVSVVAVITVLGCLIALLVYRRTHNRLVYWI